MLTENSIRLLQSYQKQISSYDEIVDSKGQVKPVWATLFASIEKIGIQEMTNRKQEIVNTLREIGATYNVYESPDGMNRPWQLDSIPFLIEQKEWQQISRGLQQRATLLDLMLKDIYGDGRLLKDGILPPELVYGNTGFYRACHDAKIAGSKQLLVHAVDMARGPDGRMWVLDNRTQAPSGSGYALVNRSVVSKLLPELAEGMYVSRLAPFFTTMQNTLIQASGRLRDNLNIVYLTPGPNNESYFEQAYLASYLGYPLVQGDDLLVRDGYVWLKSIDGLERVDVIIRRIDDEWCDPLELREDSRLGVPGLLHAIRMGNVTVVNPPGSSVLENNALHAFLPTTCRYLLGEDLILPPIATWWCGQTAELNYVLENLHKLIIKKANRRQKFRSVYGRLLSRMQLQELKKAIRESPSEYIAQEEVSFSTTPSLIGDTIEPRYAAIRAYLIASENGYQVMQGGLTRSSPEKDRFVVSNQYGSISKDTWIVSDRVEEVKEKITLSAGISIQKHTSLPSRSAENLFWVGRYCERTLSTTTFIGITLDVLNGHRNFGGSTKSEHMELLLRALTHLTLTYPGFVEDEKGDILKNPYPEILDLISNAQKTGTIAYNIQSFLMSIIAVRDKWNLETWRIVDLIENILKKIKDPATLNTNTVQQLLDKLQTRLFTFYGILSETMPRNNEYLLLEAGKQMERILLRISILRSTLVFKYEESTEHEILEAVLLYHHLLVNYRMMYRAQLTVEATLDMILLEETLPYSLVYQLNALSTCLGNLPRAGQNTRLNQAQKAVLEASALVKLSDITQLSKYDSESFYREDLDKLLSEVSRLISSVSVTLTSLYFSHTIMQHSFIQSNDNGKAHEI
ncbi:circularly permuted type 2 ATP-grasp protein [Xanthocytophaga flava]|uniref:circularly permuted type 2 ATP-grasp protein n=1 Tax=Xanthocytophaga flava TaxID=3048013 RepID=UPI0028D69506|nr:circularly permuted type 2 ATP-grasp protein [Xanthocytophaga flavus]MDJ1471550.1 circularly permuted type 2 ATP-grasp protein [Xanthocytophaga flavus]